MFNSLSNRLGKVFDSLARRGILTEAMIDEAMREIRIALLEADVSLPVVKEFIAKVKEQASGEKVVKSIKPSDQVVKIVHDALIETLGSDASAIEYNTNPPSVFMMLGLQGSGKTTSSAKLGRFLKNKENKKVLTASVDIYRPAAKEQLAIACKTAEIDCVEIIANEKPIDTVARALKQARVGGYDVLIIDTAGRLQIDAELMEELKEIKKFLNPIESLLVADSLTGQEAANIAKTFNEEIGLSGIILTRIDGDGRGGAALSMKSITGKPIKFIGTGEKVSDFEIFHPKRLAGRILDMGDVVSLVEKTMENIDHEQAQKSAEAMLKGKFTLEDMLGQLQQMQKMGDLSGLLSVLPGAAKMKEKLAAANIDDKMIKHQEAIILSMTIKERRNPDIIKAKRKIRIANGAGLKVQDVNKVLKQYEVMKDTMKKMKSTGFLGKLLGGMGGGMPAGLSDMMKGMPKGGDISPDLLNSLPKELQNMDFSNPNALPFMKK